MKTTTPLSFAMAAGLAISMYATPWGLMWALGLAPPEFDVQTLPQSDAIFVAIDVEDLEDLEDPGDDPDARDDEDVEGAEDGEDGGDDADAERGPADGDATADAEGTAEPGSDGTAQVEGEGPGKLARASDGPAKPKRPAKRRRRRPPKCVNPHPHVRRGRDGVVEIDREFVERVTKNLRTFMKLGYSRPYREDGVKGWYISGFGCASPVFKAGFRRKDVLLTVNGKNTRTVTGVFMLYLKLKKKSDFEVRLLRRGKQRTLRFRVVPS